MRVMNEQEVEENIRLMKEYYKKLAGNKELARDFLIRAGIYTKKGKLAKPYKHLHIPPM
ncbi:MAG: hypothetical protein LBL04_04715 [Bacteroidales bacterium]|nr:hypothetical protein [Bacteroidales bacterium]